MVSFTTSAIKYMARKVLPHASENLKKGVG